MDFTKPWKQGDVTFIVEDKKIYANKTVLSISSEVFAAMFDSDFTEKNMKDINLPDKKFSDFLEFMEVLHPAHYKAIDASNACQLFPLGHEYQVEAMMEQCEQFMLRHQVTLKHLALADKFSLVELRDKCMDEYVRHTGNDTIQQDEHYKELSEDTKTGIRLTKEKASIENFLLAEKHRWNFSYAYEKCLKYLKDTPLSQLKQQKGFGDISKMTLIDVLMGRVEQLEACTTDIKQIVRSGVYCANTSHLYKHILGSESMTCSACIVHKGFTEKIITVLDRGPNTADC